MTFVNDEIEDKKCTKWTPSGWKTFFSNFPLVRFEQVWA